MDAIRTPFDPRDTGAAFCSRGPRSRWSPSEGEFPREMTGRLSGKRRTQRIRRSRDGRAVEGPLRNRNLDRIAPLNGRLDLGIREEMLVSGGRAREEHEHRLPSD